MERWLGELEQCTSLLLKIFDDIIERNQRDSDVQNGLHNLHSIGTEMCDRIKPMADKYKDNKDWGKRRAHTLAETLFFSGDKINSGYLMLETMQGLHVYLSYIKGSLRGTLAAAKALWDADLIACVEKSSKDIARMEEWALQQMQTKAPQTLIVPLPVQDGQM